MTLDQHIETANDLAVAAHYLNQAFDRCQKHFPKSHKVMQKLRKIKPGVLGGGFSAAQSALDSDFHRVASDTDFKKHGHIYYNLEARYSKLKNDLVC